MFRGCACRGFSPGRAGGLRSIRWFFCDHVDCHACTFVEQVSGLPNGTPAPVRLRSQLEPV